MNENDIRQLQHAMRDIALLERGPATRREAVKRLAEGFGFTVTDPDAADLARAADELGIDFARETAATQNMIADMERDGLL